MGTYLKGWRTLGSSVLCAVAGLTLAAQDYLTAFGLDIKTVLGDFIPSKYVGATMLGMAIWFGACRLITTTKVGERE